MPHQLDFFIDAHCHMFTIADIPLNETVKHAVDSIHPLTGGMLGAVAGIGGSKLLKPFEPLISFMESEPIQNPRRIEREVGEALKAARIVPRQLIATPLIMDFDLNGKVEKLRGQVERLVEAAGHCKQLKVLPFLGLDPRRFVYSSSGKVQSKAKMKAALAAYLRPFGLPSKTTRRDPSKLKGGDLIGIKLYPPLGFSPLPSEAKAKQRHLDFYEDLCDRDLPITTHCQPTSFSFVTKKQVNAYTNPGNWLKVLTALKQERGKDLRLNLGHFGGDTGLERLIGTREDRKDDPYPERGHLRPKTWTYQIAALLRKFPQAYADISAIDFNDKHSASAFLWLLKFDQERPPAADEHALVDKLMWGSDYPMALGKQVNNYQRVLSSFLQAYSGLPRTGSKRHPRPADLPPRAEIIAKLCCDNPRAFLFGPGA